MPWTEPTLKQLTEQAGQDLSTRLLDGRALEPNSVLSVLAATLAGGNRQMYYFLAWAFLQIFPDTAEAEYLQRWADIWGVARKQAGTAEGLVMVTGLAGSAVPEGALIQLEDGRAYALAGGIFPSGGGEVVMEMAAHAVTPGAAGNLAAGVELSFISPVAGVKSIVVVGAEGLTGGADQESDDSLRARLLSIIQSPPHGGNKTDYEHWALEIPGVVNALCYPTYAGLGTVAVAVWGDIDDPVLPDALVQKVYEHLRAECPVTAGPGLYVFTPQPLVVNFTIVLRPDTLEIRENVRLELGDVFAREARPGQVIVRSHLTEAISLAAGEYDHNLISPVGAVEPALYQLPVLGEITFLGDLK